jgi:NAD(P)-dependent dehydrogenase (short-subunit alcohol dehydrogenase family)
VSTDGLRDFRGVFSFASGTSFHHQIFPDATLSLGFSASAMHWLSRLPATLGDHVHAVTARGAVRDAFAAQAAADWETILLHRARELVPGGQLVFANFCIDDAGRYSGATGERNLFETLARLWRALHVSTYGRLDAAFNNAGVNSDSAAFLETSDDEFERVMNVNLRGVWNCMKGELRQMMAQGSGAIVNCSSIGGLKGSRGRSA